jgi:hypothetical protein
VGLSVRLWTSKSLEGLLRPVLWRDREVLQDNRQGELARWCETRETRCAAFSSLHAAVAIATARALLAATTRSLRSKALVSKEGKSYASAAAGAQRHSRCGCGLSSVFFFVF